MIKFDFPFLDVEGSCFIKKLASLLKCIIIFECLVQCCAFPISTGCFIILHTLILLPGMHPMQVVKKQGLIIQPINYEDVDPHERGEEHRGSGQKQRQNQRIIRSQGRVKALVAKS